MPTPPKALPQPIPEAIVQVLEKIADVSEYHDGTGLLQYRPRTSAGEARELAASLLSRLRSSSYTMEQFQPPTARPLEEWHEDYGFAVWWTWRDGEWLGEPSYIGSPLCSDWPGYHTHWTPHPDFPNPPASETGNG